MSASANSSPATSHTNPLRVVKLKRVSTEEQTTGGGLNAQDRIVHESLDEIDRKVSVVSEIHEEGVSGTNFPRRSLLKVLEMAQENKLDAVAVKDVSRIGRIAAPTFGFIWLLNHWFNIELIVEDGRYNIQRKTDLIQIFFRTLNAELKNRFRTSYVHESQLEDFRQGHFHVTGRHVRFGYKKITNGENGTEEKGRINEGDELKVDKKEAEVIEALFSALVDAGPAGNAFARARDKVRDKFSQERLPDDGIDLKEVLRNPIYKGRPTWEINATTEDTKSAVMKREDLRIVKDSKFEDVQDILDVRDRRYTRSASDKEDDPDRLTVQQIASLVGLSRLVAFDDVVRIHCPDCGAEMNDNGKWRATSDLKPSNVDGITDDPILKRYSCPSGECERSEKRFPNEFEAYLLFDSEVSLKELTEH